MIHSRDELKKKIQRPSVKAPVVDTVTDADHERMVNSFKDLRAKFEKIADKQKCMRVRFLDWLAAKILHYGKTWSNSIKRMSDKIDSPCIIKINVKGK